MIILEKETKIAVIISKLGTMINDWAETADEDIKEAAEKLIIETARKLSAVADDKTLQDNFPR